MSRLVITLIVWFLMIGLVKAQSKTTPATPPAIVTVVERITAKQFEPDTAFAALSEEDITMLGQEPIANWGLAQENGDMVYYNLIIGTRSYQLVITQLPKASYPTATLLRFTTPKSKPEPIAQGALKPKSEKPR